MKFLKTSFVIAFAMLAFGGAGSVSTGAEKPVVSLATVVGAVAPWCLTTAFFYEPAFGPPGSSPGIDVQKILMEPVPRVLAVNSGQVDAMDCVGLGSVAQAYAKGAHDLVIVGVNGSVPAYVLIGAKNLKTLADFRGKSMASNGGATTATQAAERILLRGAGLQPDRDYNVVSAASGSTRLGALTSGKVDGIVAFPPVSYTLVESGFRQLGSERQYTPNYLQGALVLNRKWAQEHRAVVVAMLKSMVMTGRWMADPTKKTAVIAKLAGVTMNNAKLGRDYASRIYADTISLPGGEGQSGGADRALFENTIQYMIEGGLLPKGDYPLDQFVDFSYLNEARRQLKLPPLKGV